jgi:hypothetical protein
VCQDFFFLNEYKGVVYKVYTKQTWVLLHMHLTSSPCHPFIIKISFFFKEKRVTRGDERLISSISQQTLLLKHKRKEKIQQTVLFIYLFGRISFLLELVWSFGTLGALALWLWVVFVHHYLSMMSGLSPSHHRAELGLLIFYMTHESDMNTIRS